MVKLNLTRQEKAAWDREGRILEARTKRRTMRAHVHTDPRNPCFTLLPGTSLGFSLYDRRGRFSARRLEARQRHFREADGLLRRAAERGQTIFAADGTSLVDPRRYVIVFPAYHRSIRLFNPASLLPTSSEMVLYYAAAVNNCIARENPELVEARGGNSKFVLSICRLSGSRYLFDLGSAENVHRFLSGTPTEARTYDVSDHWFESARAASTRPFGHRKLYCSVDGVLNDDPSRFRFQAVGPLLPDIVDPWTPREDQRMAFTVMGHYHGEPRCDDDDDDEEDHYDRCAMLVITGVPPCLPNELVEELLDSTFPGRIAPVYAPSETLVYTRSYSLTSTDCYRHVALTMRFTWISERLLGRSAVPNFINLSDRPLSELSPVRLVDHWGFEDDGPAQPPNVGLSPPRPITRVNTRHRGVLSFCRADLKRPEECNLKLNLIHVDRDDHYACADNIEFNRPVPNAPYFEHDRPRLPQPHWADHLMDDLFRPDLLIDVHNVTVEGCQKGGSQNAHRYYANYLRREQSLCCSHAEESFRNEPMPIVPPLMANRANLAVANRADPPEANRAADAGSDDDDDASTVDLRNADEVDEDEIPSEPPSEPEEDGDHPMDDYSDVDPMDDSSDREMDDLLAKYPPHHSVMNRSLVFSCYRHDRNFVYLDQQQITTCCPDTDSDDDDSRPLSSPILGRPPGREPIGRPILGRRHHD